MDVEKQNFRPMWKSLKRQMDHEEPTPMTNQVFLGCTQGEAKVNTQAVQSKTELFRRLTSNVDNGHRESDD